MTMEPIYTYRFTRADYEALQNYFLDQDVFGSSWKGEEVITISRDLITREQNDQVLAQYPLSQFDGFFVDPSLGTLTATWRFILLVKKPEAMSFSERAIRPLFFGNMFIAGLSQKTRLKILGSKLGEFTQALSSVLPELSDSAVQDLKKETVLNVLKFRLAVCGIILAIGIIVMIGIITSG